jgi:hypothetical protein
MHGRTKKAVCLRNQLTSAYALTDTDDWLGRIARMLRYRQDQLFGQRDFLNRRGCRCFLMRL